ncbi:MAG TPA: hypothetical protein ENG74_01695 [Thermoplasmatales archaeon]|nr:hypothetical protein [Thermoplasmatales archaeon]
MLIEIIKKPRRGKPIRIIQKAHSPLRNWGTFLNAYFGHRQDTVVDTSGNSQTVYGYSPSHCNSSYLRCGIDLSAKAPEGNSSYGIVVGGGDTPVSFDDYKLASQFTHGTGENQIYHYGTIVSLSVGGSVTIDGVNYKTMVLTVERAFQNEYSASQTIKEIGLILHYYTCYASANKCVSYNFLAFRDVLDQYITLASGEGVTLRYHFRWLHPA